MLTVHDDEQHHTESLMGAQMTIDQNLVTVRIYSNLTYKVWEILRDARNAALAANLPLRIEVDTCIKADMGGIGAILIAQEKLSDVEICGCSPLFAKCFKAFGVCDHCTHHGTPCIGKMSDAVPAVPERSGD
jgi:hypothetical protein